ncbi:MAG: endonuclease domain-containing protein [Eubacteriales bacterium]|nr:endonuclease domain-containing protein [Eubacteriales bacterium]
MDRKYNKNIVPFARNLRKNMTKEERHLWYDFLRNYPIKITRQKVLGKYIADFYCAKANLAIELDGSQHYEYEGLISDEKRTEYLKEYGIKVIRISNLDVMENFEGVCMLIDKEIRQSLSQLS